MYLAIEPQPDCVAAWLAAVHALEARRHEANNVIIDIADPLSRATLADPAVRAVDAFLRAKDVKPIETVANTLFPAGLYRRHGTPAFYDRFKEVLPLVSRSEDWSGYYFERMIALPGGRHGGNQLIDIIDRLKDPAVKARNKFELSIFDPARDVDRSPYGGQCLSHASFKLRKAGGRDRLDLTALYRNHYYIEKLLGNLIGLGRLMQFVAGQAGVEVGSLTIVSTHACVDLPGKKPHTATRAEVQALIRSCDSLMPG